MTREAHKWGESPAADAVRELVVGLAPSIAGKRLLVAFQAYIDDSIGSAGDFVLAGHIARADMWEAFSREWERVLPLGLRDERGWYFKMSEMAALPERMDRVPAFYRVMEDHILLSLSVHFKVGDLQSAVKRIFHHTHNINWSDFNNPHFFAFRAILDMFHWNKERIADKVPLDQPVDFIFDEHQAKKPLLEIWDRYIDSLPEPFRSRFGATPIFRDDRQFLPLQAADLWAWWVREWYETGDPIAEHMTLPNFGKWKARDSHHKLVIQFNEDHIIENLHEIAASGITADTVIYANRDKGIVGLQGKKPIPDD